MPKSVKPYKPSSVLPRFEPAAWEEYAFKGGSLSKATNQDLARIVRRAAKAANQRLRRLEKLSLTSSAAYKRAMDTFDNDRKRFKERTGKLSRSELLKEYWGLQDFLGAKSSTPTGIRSIEDKRYLTAKERGFEGSPDEFKQLVEKFFQKATEKLLSSDVIYMAITENSTDIIDEILADIESGELTQKRSMVQEYIRRFERKRAT